MIARIMASVLALFMIVGSVAAQDVPVPAPVSAGASVPGLELPPNQTVNFDEGFVNIQAKCKGDVKWLVVSQVKVKYITVPQTSSIILSVPPQGGVITVFAVGLVDGKLTDFASTNVTVVQNGPSPGPAPGPVDPSQKLHLTFLIDMNNPSPELAKLLNSETLRKGINQKGHWFRLYDIKSPIVAQKNLAGEVAKVGGNNVLIVQSDNGRVLVARAIPNSEAEIFAIIQQITGK
jgi:hypothetical protein